MKLRNIFKQEKFEIVNKSAYFIFGILFIVGAFYYKSLLPGIIGIFSIIVGFSYGNLPWDKKKNLYKELEKQYDEEHTEENDNEPKV